MARSDTYLDATLRHLGVTHFGLAEQHHGRWHHRVRDVMTTSVQTAGSMLMNSRRLRRLPVFDADGKLIGIVSRCDLLSVFLRPGEDIAREVREVLTEILLAGRASVTGRVRNGIVARAPARRGDHLPHARAERS